MPTPEARLKSKDRTLRLLGGTIAIGAVSFLFLVFMLFDSSQNQTIKSNNQNYRSDVKTIMSAREGCLRSVYERLENIDGDIRQSKFFRDAEVARRAGGTALDRKTADKYGLNSRESSAAAARRTVPLDGIDLGILRQRVPAVVRGKRAMVPSDASRAETKRYCAMKYTLPEKPKDPPLFPVG